MYTILFVDDEAAIRSIVKDMLEQAGEFKVLLAETGEAALELLKDADILVTDMVMPGMSGAELAEEARRRRPELPVCYVTGYSDSGFRGECGRTGLLRKPFTARQLIQTLKRVLA